MNDSVFDPLLGRLRSVDAPKVNPGGGTITNQTTNLLVGAGTGISLPATGNDGDIFYDTDDGVLYIWANGMWNAISGGSTPPSDTFMLMETGDFILLENGDKIILE